MSVRVLPARVATRSEKDINRKWGLVAERIDRETREAIRDVLLYLHYDHDEPPLLGHPADVAHAHACFNDGWQQAMATAADALTDDNYIRERRGLIEDKFTKEPESDE